MVDFNGSGGLAGFNPFGGMASGPAMSAGQINSSMGYNPNANPYDPFAQSGGFGAMTDYYSGLGAAYGRNTGGFGGYGGQNDPFSPAGGGGYGGAADQAWYLGGSQGPRPSESGGGGGGVFSTGAPAYNDYGGYANPGAFSPSPNYPGGSGGGGNSFGGAADQAWYLGGSQGQRPSSFNDYGGGANPGGFSPSPNYPGGGSANAYGGAADQAWYLGGSQGPRPSDSGGGGGGSGYNPYSPQSYAPAAQQNIGGGRNDLAGLLWQGTNSATNNQFGGGADQMWYLNGSQGQRPSTMYSGNFFGANNGTGIGQGAGMAPGYGGFNTNPAAMFTGAYTGNDNGV